jgi:uncharacterized protein YigE (DUF2233 family)
MTWRGSIGARMNNRYTTTAMVALASIFVMDLASARTPKLIAHVERSIPRTQEGGARAIVFEFDTNLVQARVISTVMLKPEGQRAGSGLSIADAASRPEIRSLGTRELLLISGGYSGSSTGRPVGLLISDGQTISVPEYVLDKGVLDDKCPALRKDHYRYDGVMCSTATGALKIDGLESVNVEVCKEAVQAGPMLVEDGKVPFCKTTPESPSFVRTALCSTPGMLRVVVALDPITLPDLAYWMAAGEKGGGLGCSSAINLGGYTSAAAIYFPGHGQAPVAFGEGVLPQASLIAFVAK